MPSSVVAPNRGSEANGAPGSPPDSSASTDAARRRSSLTRSPSGSASRSAVSSPSSRRGGRGCEQPALDLGGVGAGRVDHERDVVGGAEALAPCAQELGAVHQLRSEREHANRAGALDLTGAPGGAAVHVSRDRLGDAAVRSAAPASSITRSAVAIGPKRSISSSRAPAALARAAAGPTRSRAARCQLVHVGLEPAVAAVEVVDQTRRRRATGTSSPPTSQLLPVVHEREVAAPATGDRRQPHRHRLHVRPPPALATRASTYASAAAYRRGRSAAGRMSVKIRSGARRSKPPISLRTYDSILLAHGAVVPPVGAGLQQQADRIGGPRRRAPRRGAAASRPCARRSRSS